MVNLSSPARIIQTDFRSGEIDPILATRVDAKFYATGARSLKNGLLRVGGSVSRRPGSTRITSLPSKRRLISFEYDSDEKYIFAFGASALAIYDGQGTLLQTVSSGSCPWTTDLIVSEMTFCSAGDTMIVCHTSFRPKVIKRTSLTSFTVTDFAFAIKGVIIGGSPSIAQPYYKFAAADVTLQVSSNTVGSGRTLTASQPVFSAASVDSVFRIFGCEMVVTGYTSTTVVTVSVTKLVQLRLDSNPFRVTSGSGIIEVTMANHGLKTSDSITVAGAPDVLGIAAANINGSRTVGAIIDEDRFNITAGAGDTASDSGDGGGGRVDIQVNGTGVPRWDEQVFSAVRGWPTACAFHENRLWLGGSTSLPDGLFSSKTGNFYNFDVGTGLDTDSIQVTLGAQRVAQIKHIVASSVLQIFTEGAEFVARQSSGAGLTPATISILPQTPYGCSNVRPRVFDGATLFVQANSKTIREYSYEQQRDSYLSVDITSLSQHLVSGVVDMDVLYGSLSRTEQYAFVVNGDGTMGVFHSNRAEGLASWTPWETVGGIFESVCVLGTIVYASVLRSGTRYLERIEMDNPDILLDWSISQDNGVTPKTSWALGSTYASQTLHVVSNGWYLGTVTANGSGTITTPSAVTSITAGLDSGWEVIPLPPDMGLQDGPMTGEKRRVSSVNVHVYETLSLRIDGRNVVITQIGADLSVPPAPITRKIKRFLMGYERDPLVTFTQLAPLPVTILGLTMEISI